jgi:hypothetical protein
MFPPTHTSPCYTKNKSFLTEKFFLKRGTLIAPGSLGIPFHSWRWLWVFKKKERVGHGPAEKL